MYLTPQALVLSSRIFEIMTESATTVNNLNNYYISQAQSFKEHESLSELKWTLPVIY